MSELEHFGVKGMKWGKRNSKTLSSSGANTKKAKQHKMGDIVGTGSDGSETIYVGGAGTAGRFLRDDEQQEINDLVDEMNALHDEELALINSIEDQGGDFTKDPKVEELENKKSKKYDRYYELYTKAQKARQDSYANGRKNDPMPQLRGEFMPEPGGNTYTRSKSVAAGPDDVKFKTKDRKNTVTHTDIDNYLEHHGIKGMKWGVRKERSSGSSSSTSSKAKTSKSKSVPKGKAAAAKKPSKKSNAFTDFFDADKRANKKISKLKEKTKSEKAETARKQKLAKAEAELAAAKQQNSPSPAEVEERKLKKKKDNKTYDRLLTADMLYPMDNPVTDAMAVGADIAAVKNMRSNGKKKYESASNYSDADLKKVINRIEMEKKYSILMEERRPKSKAEKFKKFAKTTATNALKNEGQKIIGAAVGAGVSYAMAKAIGDSTAGDATTQILSKAFGGGKKKDKNQKSDYSGDSSAATKQYGSDNSSPSNSPSNSPQAKPKSHGPNTLAPRPKASAPKPSPSASERRDRIQRMLDSSTNYLDSQRNSQASPNSMMFSGKQASTGRSPAGQRAVSIISKYEGSKPKTYTFGKSESISDSLKSLNTNIGWSKTLNRPYAGPGTSLASRQGFDGFSGNKRKKR